MTAWWPTEWHSPDHKRYVYFLAPVGGGLIKIGCAKEPRVRLRGMIAWSPVPLEILTCAPGNFFDERKLHSMFFEHHSHSEWFRPCPELLALIARIKATGELPPECHGVNGERIPLRIKNGTGESSKLKSEGMKRAWAQKRAAGIEWAHGRKHRIGAAA